MNPAAVEQPAPTLATSKSRIDAAMAAWMRDLAPYGVFTTDCELRIASWNEWLAVHSSLAESKVIGRSVLEVFPALSERRLADRYKRALAGEVSMLSTALHKYLLSFPVTVVDSGLPHMLQTARIAPLHQGPTVIGTITFIEDVTQREVQAAILNRQQELDRILSSALAQLLQSNEPAREMDGIFSTIQPALGLDVFVCYLVGPDGKALHLNSSGGLTPKQRDAIITHTLDESDWEKLLGEDPGSAVLNQHRHALQKLGLKGCASFALAVGPRLIGLATFGSYQRDSIAPADLSILARITRYVAISLDRAAREREAHAASNAKDDFLAALSHELRTPLNPVLLVASDAAQNQSFSPEAREAFHLIEKNALLEARLIDDLLDLTRIERGKISMENQKLDVNAVVLDALATVRAEAEEHSLTLRVELGTEKTTSLGDAGRLQQVFWNIIRNAVKFTPPGGEVCVSSSVAPESGEVVVTIRDTGIGMDAQELSRVFEAFAQGDHATAGRSHRFGGLGLGLAISRKLVDLHGGRITASSAGKEKGATFCVHLPLAKREARLVGTGVEVKTKDDRDKTVMPFPTRAGSRLLLIEDHSATRTALSQMLIRRGYDVVTAESAAAALQAAADASFDLVLSDIGLPDGDGFQVMRLLRDQYGLRGIALTGYGMEEDLVRSHDAGFLAHLTKPINASVLDRALESFFSNAARK